MKNSKPDEAARVRDAQLTGLLAGIDYRKLREIDKSLIDSYIRPAMLEDDLFAGHLDDLLTAPAVAARPAGDPHELAGLDLLEDDDEPNPDEVSMRRLFDMLVDAEEGGSVCLSEEDGANVVTRTALMNAVKGVIHVAIENKILDARAGDILQAPTNFLRDAARAIDKARDAYDVVRTSVNFNGEAFDRACNALERAIEGLTESREGQPSFLALKVLLDD